MKIKELRILLNLADLCRERIDSQDLDKETFTALVGDSGYIYDALTHLDDITIESFLLGKRYSYQSNTPLKEKHLIRAVEALWRFEG